MRRNQCAGNVDEGVATQAVRWPPVIWLTGLSGAGKSTLAKGVERHFLRRQLGCYILDGDALRRGLCRDLGYSLQDRAENVRRAGEVAALLVDAGLAPIVAMISPLRSSRELVRSLFSDGQFIEVFVNTPLKECQRRDVKGLYARAGQEGLGMTGLKSPYEPPLRPEVEIATLGLTVEASLAVLTDYIDRVLMWSDSA